MRETSGPAERGISHDAIHILFQPPRKNQPGLRNTKTLKLQRFREGSANQKNFFAKVSYRDEFISKFANECTFFSYDDRKSKWAYNPHFQDIINNICFLCQKINLTLGIMIYKIQAT